MNDRRFDSLTGQPRYAIRGCQHLKEYCAYPYCSCEVKHDELDRPLPARGRPNWPLLYVLAVDLVVFVLVTLAILHFALRVI